jgi:hypothetical protein
MRLEPAHESLEESHELCFGTAQLAAQSSQLGRCVVAYAAVVGKDSLERTLLRLGRDEIRGNRREDGGGDRRAPRVTQRFSSAPGRPKKNEHGEKLDTG